jgi:hypothetical protein
MNKALIKLVENIADLFKIRSIISLLVIITSCIMTLQGKMEVATFIALASAIITYYFTRKDK